MSENDQQAPSSSRLGSWGLSAWQMGRNAALGAAEYMTPVLTQSQFAENGVLTPDEFVAAGDMLVLRCPTWQWQAGDPKLAKAFLPANKQFLITRNVPCQRRAVSVQLGADELESLRQLHARPSQAHMGVRAGEDFLGLERLGDEIDGAQRKAAHLVVLGVFGRDHDYHDLPVLLANAFADVEAGLSGEHDVQEDEIRPQLAGEL